GFTLRYTASGLPPGLSINPSTGLISGTVTFPGNYTVVAGATDPTLGSDSTVFSWSVKPPLGAVHSFNHQARCVNDQNGNLANGPAVNIWSCNGTLAQKWATFPDGSLRRYGGPSQINTNRCMNIAGGGTANGTKINIQSCIGKWYQKWTYHSASRVWVNPHTGKCLNDPGGNLTNGTRLVITTCNGSSGGKWTNV